jgi:hypothetical protein
MISANIRPERGAISLGFKIMVQPAAMAGATLQTIWFNGQFHGVIIATTPIGSRKTRVPARSLDHSYVSSVLSIWRKWSVPINAC